MSLIFILRFDYFFFECNMPRTSMYILIVFSHNIVNSSYTARVPKHTNTLNSRVKDANWPPRHRCRSSDAVCTYIPTEWLYQLRTVVGALLRR